MTDPLEELFSLTSGKAAEAAALADNRPRDRSPLLSFRARTPAGGMRAASRTNNFGDTKSGIEIDLVNVQPIQAVTPVAPGSDMVLFVPVADRDRNGNVNQNSEGAQMGLSIKAASGEKYDNIGDLRGTEWEATEDVHKFTGRRAIHKAELTDAKALELGVDTSKEPDEQGRYWYNAEFRVRYYKVTSITPLAGSNGTKPTETAKVTQDDIDGISNFFSNLAPDVEYEKLTFGNVLIQLKSLHVNTDQPEIQKAAQEKTLRQFLADRMPQEVTA